MSLQEIFSSKVHSIKSLNAEGLDDEHYNTTRAKKVGEEGGPADEVEIRRTEEGLDNMSILQEEFGRGNVGVLMTYFNTFKCYIGIGILTTPFAYHEVIE